MIISRADLWIAFSVHALLGGTAAILVFRASRRWSLAHCNFLAFKSIVSLIVFVLIVRGASWWAAIWPIANVLVWSDFLLPLVGFFCGSVWANLPGHTIRKLILLSCLTGPAIWLASDPLRSRPPLCFDAWSKDVCLQSSESSCSAAAAVTLLRTAGISATEQEMAELCLTRRGKSETDGGTQFLGLYRGLRLKTEGTPHSVDAWPTSLDRLLEDESGPWIVSVGLNSKTSDPIYRERYGWPPGLRHSVVLFGRAPGDRVSIGDPSIGKEEWTVEDLRVLWLGDALRLRRRSP